MKTGIVRKIDDLGRIVIPKEMRRVLNINIGDPIEMHLEGNKICMELYNVSDSYENMINRIIKSLKEEYYVIENKAEAISALEEASNLLKNKEK